MGQRKTICSLNNRLARATKLTNDYCARYFPSGAVRSRSSVLIRGQWTDAHPASAAVHTTPIHLLEPGRSRDIVFAYERQVGSR